MTGNRALSDPNHLPWLDDSRAPAPKAPGPLLLVVGALGAMVIASGIIVWLGEGAGGGIEVAAPVSNRIDPPRTTIRLPATEPTRAAAGPVAPPGATPAPPSEAAPAAPQATVEPPPVVRPAPLPPVRLASNRRPPAPTSRARKPAGDVAAVPASTSKAGDRPAAPPPASSGYWPRPAAAVGLGRVIRLSRYTSREDVQRGWYSLQRSYPQLTGLPTVTVANRGTDGRLFYRLHIVTTAKAQSEWLCNRLQRDLRHCTVVATNAL